MPEPAPTRERLLALVDAMHGQPVAMWVDLVVDRYVAGTPKRISREAPVLILRHDGERSVPGGGANAVANVIALGGRPVVVGMVGDDGNGDALLEALETRGADTRGIQVRRGYHTPTKTRILAGARHAIKQQIVRVDVEDSIQLREEECRRLLDTLATGGPYPVAVLSDYGYGTVDPSLWTAVRSVLGDHCAIIGDSRFRLSEFRGLDGATPNLEEAEALLGAAVGDDVEPLADACRSLGARLATRHVLVTRGSDGMALLSGDAVALLAVHGTDQVADVTGAGDTVIGTFALALAAGASPLEAACLANYAGGVVVRKMGTATLGPDELRAAVAGDPTPLRELRWAVS